MDLVDVAARDLWVLCPEVPEVPSAYSRSCRTGRNVRNRGGLCRGCPMFARGVRIPRSASPARAGVQRRRRGTPRRRCDHPSPPGDCAGWSPRSSSCACNRLALPVGLPFGRHRTNIRSRSRRRPAPVRRRHRRCAPRLTRCCSLLASQDGGRLVRAAASPGRAATRFVSTSAREGDEGFAAEFSAAPGSPAGLASWRSLAAGLSMPPGVCRPTTRVAGRGSLA